MLKHWEAILQLIELVSEEDMHRAAMHDHPGPVFVVHVAVLSFECKCRDLVASISACAAATKTQNFYRHIRSTSTDKQPGMRPEHEH